MSTVIVSGRVDARTREKVAPILKTAGLTQGDVIKVMWENIAATGEVPRPVADSEKTKKQKTAFERFMEFRSSLPPCPELENMTDAEMRDMIVERYL